MLSRWVPMMFWAVLITRCRALLSWAVHKPCQFVRFPVRIVVPKILMIAAYSVEYHLVKRTNSMQTQSEIDFVPKVYPGCPGF